MEFHTEEAEGAQIQRKENREKEEDSVARDEQEKGNVRELPQASREAVGAC